MDDVPFLEINLEKIREAQIEEIKKFCKENFDLDNILSSANELKYMSEVKKIIRSEFNEPSPELVKLLTKRVYEGIVTQKVLDQFTDIVMRAFKSHINDVMSEKLGIAIKATEAAGAPIQTSSITTEQKDEDGYPIQAYTLHILEPIYPDPALSVVENVSAMKAENERVWKECYEKVYGIKLAYTTVKK